MDCANLLSMLADDWEASSRSVGDDADGEIRDGSQISGPGQEDITFGT